MTPNSRNEKIITAAELTTGVLLTLALVTLHLAVLRHAGALWRDEVHTVNLASMPLAEMWTATLTNESFPVLWPLTLRTWMGMGWGETDWGLRVLGLVVGLGLISTLWWIAYRFNYRVPLISLVLIGASPTIFRYGDSLRAWGLGCILLLLMLVAIYRVVEQNTLKRHLIAGVLAILTAQCLYYNCVLLFAVSCSAAVVFLRRFELKRTIALGAIGLVAAVSITPYLLDIPTRSIGLRSSQSTISLRMITDRFAEAVNLSGDFMFPVWLGLLGVSLAFCVYRYFRFQCTEQRDRALFFGLTIVTAAACYVGFLLRLSMLTQRWYYAALIAILAVTMEAAIHLGVQNKIGLRLTRLGLVLLLAFSIWPRVWDESAQTDDQRRSNCYPLGTSGRQRRLHFGQSPVAGHYLHAVLRRPDPVGDDSAASRPSPAPRGFAQ